MNIKTFRARTLRDALAMVRAELGPQAAVLHTREVNSGPVARLLRGRGVEVAATPDHSPLAAQAAKTGAVVGSGSTTPPPARGEGRARENAPHAAQSDAQVQVCGELIAADVAPELARSLVREAVIDRLDADSGVAAFREATNDAFRSRLRVGGPIRLNGGRRVVALVGATGVGKTTTLAKLAANFRLRDGVRVGLVTVDTYRVAAVEQLRTYAEIIDLPMEVVSAPGEMRRAVEKLGDLDLVLIDTDGRSPRDGARIDELQALLAEAAPDETHLVASVTNTARGLRDTVERFAAVRPTSLLLTKLDEAPSIGHAAAPVVEAGLPIGYLTDGQSVPEDIRVADADSLAAAFLGGAALAP